MRALTLDQPYATLVALGVKTIETRSWATSYRGPIAIHASTRRPSHMYLPPLMTGRGRGRGPDPYEGQRWTVIDTITDPAWQRPIETHPHRERVPKSAQTPTLFFPHAGPHGRPHQEGTPATEQGTAVYLPLGALVATATLTDVLPIVDGINHGWSDVHRLGRAVMHRSTEAFGGTLDGLWLCSWGDGQGNLDGYLNDQLPYGDFRPGRHAWLLEDIKPVDPPRPARGRQGLWTWDE